MRRAEPIPGESFPGLFARFAAENGFDRMRHVTDEVDPKFGHRQLHAIDAEADVSGLADVLGCEASELALRQHLLVDDPPLHRDFFGVAVHRYALETRTRRFSRGSLLLSEHHRALWLLRPLTFCPESWELLESECAVPWCRRRQGWDATLGVAHCDRCANPLSQGPVEHVPSELRADLLQVLRLVDPDPLLRAEAKALLPDCLQPFEGGTLLETMLRLARYLDPCLKVPWKELDRPLARELNRRLASSWQMLTSWPGSVIDHIHATAYVNRRSYRDPEVDVRVGLFRKDLTVGRSPETAAVLQIARDEIDCFGKNEAALRQKTMGVTEAARLLGIGSGKLAEIRDRGAFRTHIIYNGRKGACINFDRQEVVGLKAMIDDRLTYDNAATLLGVPYYAVEQLVAMGELQPLRHPYMQFHLDVRQLSRRSLERLRQDVLDRRSPMAEPGALTLRPLMQRYGGGLKPWGWLLSALRHGKLPCSHGDGPNATERSCKLRLTDLVTVAPEHEDKVNAVRAGSADFPEGTYSKGLCKQDVGEILNIGNYSEDCPLFGPCGTPAVAKKVSVITLEALEEIAAARIGTKEIARRAGLAFQSVKHRLKALDIKRVDEAGYDRAEVEDWLDEL